jgi:hypothetical protein
MIGGNIKKGKKERANAAKSVLCRVPLVTFGVSGNQ